MLLAHKIAGEGKPVILLHGLFGAKENLGMIARPLLDDYQVISVDLRNHGRSFHSDSHSYPEMADDVVALMDELSIESATVIGHSMGGKVAMQLALNQSARVDRLIPIDIAPNGSPPHHSLIIEGLLHLNTQPLTSRPQADELLTRYETDPGTRQFLLTNLQRKEDKTLGLRLNINAIANNTDQLWTSISGTPYENPTLFIRGGSSDYITTDSLSSMKTLFPNHRIVTVVGAGHMVHAEKADEVNQRIKTFLEE